MVKEYFFIVARRVPRMYEEMQRSFAGHPHIQVILDRRRRERRWQVMPIEVNRRSTERRSRDIDALLRQLNWVVVEKAPPTI